jgi:hypothetical protein
LHLSLLLPSVPAAPLARHGCADIKWEGHEWLPDAEDRTLCPPPYVLSPPSACPLGPSPLPQISISSPHYKPSKLSPHAPCPQGHPSHLIPPASIPASMHAFLPTPPILFRTTPPPPGAIQKKVAERVLNLTLWRAEVGRRAQHGYRGIGPSVTALRTGVGLHDR